MADPSDPPNEDGTPARAPAGRPRDPALDEAIIVATRRRLVRDGYATMSLGDVAADAGVSRPTIYRRWAGKFELVLDALEWGLAAQLDSYPRDDLGALPPVEAFREAVRRLDPCYANPDAIVLQADLMSEAPRVPALLDALRVRAVEPRMTVLRDLLHTLKQDGSVRSDVDVETVTTLCFGSFFGAHLRGRPGGRELADDVAAEIWRGIST